MEKFFALSEVTQSLIFSPLAFLVSATILCLVFYFLFEKGLPKTFKFGVSISLGLSLFLGAMLYFFNDNVFGYYLKNHSGPRMMAEAKQFGGKPDEVLRVAMLNHENGRDVSQNTIKSYKGRLHLTGKQAEKFFHLFRVCMTEQLRSTNYHYGPAITAPGDLGPFRDYPITIHEMTNYVNSYRFSLDPDGSYGTHFDIDYRVPQERVERAIKKIGYTRPHPLCFSGMEIDYILAE